MMYRVAGWSPSLFLCLAALSAAGENPEVFRKQWEPDGSVKKVYDTPLGAVYEFSSGPLHKCLPYADTSDGQRHDFKCGCPKCRNRDTAAVKGSLQIRFLGSGKRNKRFVALEFYARSFPALSKKRTADSRFFIIRSWKPKIGSNYKGMDGLLQVRLNSFARFTTAYRNPAFFAFPKISGLHYRPAFQPVFLRFVFDTATGKQFRVVYNTETSVDPLIEELIDPDEPVEIRNFSIVVQSGGSDGKYRQEYLELSAPVVRQFNSSAELRNLPPPRFVPYRYDSYNVVQNHREDQSDPNQLWRRVRRHDNPDLLYSYALRYLYGGLEKRDVSRGLQLLRDAAKDKHALAFYELGVCNYRGYGVPPNPDRAIDFLKTSLGFGYTPAAALIAQIKWEQAGRPRYLTNELDDALVRIMRKCAPWDHDAQAFQRFFSGGTALAYEASPKCAGQAAPTRWLKKRGESKGDPLNFLNAAIASGYSPAYLFKGLSLPALVQPRTPGEKAETEKAALECFAQGARSGDPESRCFFLWSKARAGTLKAEELTPQLGLQLSDDPYYAFLEFTAPHPDLPGVKEFLRGDRGAAEKTWAKLGTPTAHFLLALGGWITCYPKPTPYENPWLLYNFRRQPTPQLAEHYRIAETAFLNLEKAANGGIPAAQYLYARQVLAGDIPRGVRIRSGRIPLNRGKVMLEKAAAAGHLKAAVLLAETEFREFPGRYPQLHARLEPACKLNYGPAHYLEGRIFEQERNLPEARVSYEKAIEHGDHRGYRALALLTVSDGRSEQEQEYWTKFIDADRETRSRDMFDVFWPDREYLEWGRTGDPDGSDPIRERLLRENAEEDGIKYSDSSDDPLRDSKRSAEHERRRRRRTRKFGN